MTADLNVTTDGINGIEVQADNVSLDLGGHVIRGPGEAAASGIGIRAYDRSAVTIGNGTVTEFAEGISVQGVFGHFGTNRLHDLTVSFCGQSGISFAGGIVRDIVVHNTGLLGSGRAGLSCSYCTVSSVTLRSNKEGLYINRGSAANCVATNNTIRGIVLSDSSLAGGSSHDNGSHGVHAVSRSVISGVTVSDNGGWGIYLDSGDQNNVVNCTGGGNSLGNVTGCGDGNGCHQNYLP